MNPRLQWVLVLLVTLACHVWNLGGTPIFDDKLYVSMNAEVQRGLEDWTRFFTDPNTYAGKNTHHYRPLVALSFAANAEMGLGMPGYKLTELGLHLISVLTLLWILRRLRSIGVVMAPWLPTAAAIFYGVMPFQVEALQYLTGRSAVLCGVFLILAFAVHLQLRGQSRWGPAAALYLLQMALLTAALVSKETALTMPLVFLAADLLLLPRRLTGPVFSLRFVWPYLPYMMGLVVAWMMIPNVAMATRYLALVTGEEWRLSAAIFCLIENIRLMVLGTGLTLAHPINEAGTLTDPITVVSGLLVVGLLVWGGWVWRRLPLFSFGLAWYFLLIAPSTFVHLNTVLLENRGYVAAAGIAMALGALVSKAWEGAGNRRPLAMAALVAAGLMMVTLSYGRQQVWRSEISVWEDGVRHDPSSEEAWVNLAAAYSGEDRLVEAEAALLEGIRLQPDALVARNNLASIYVRQHRYREALPIALRCLSADPGNPAYHLNVYHAYFGMKRLPEALEALEALMEVEGQNRRDRAFITGLPLGQSAVSYVNLALRLGYRDRAQQVVDTFRQNLPGDVRADVMQLQVYLVTGDRQRAGPLLQRLSERMPDDPRLARWREVWANSR